MEINKAKFERVVEEAKAKTNDRRWLNAIEKPVISRSWRANWARVKPMFELPAEIRRVVYTTNVIESLNFSLRKIIKGRSAFPNDDSVYRLIYLGLEQISRKWTMPIRNWKAALQQFAILYEDRLPLEALGVAKT
jgi:putative transposase